MHGVIYYLQSQEVNFLVQHFHCVLMKDLYIKYVFNVYLTCTEKGKDCVLDGVGKPLFIAACGPGLQCGNDNAICVTRKFYFHGIKLQRTEFITV